MSIIFMFIIENEKQNKTDIHPEEDEELLRETEI